MSFRMYKFLVGFISNFILSLYALFCVFYGAIEMNLSVSIMLSIIGTAIWILPVMIIFYPIGISIYLIIAAIIVGLKGSEHSIILLIVFILHVTRWIVLMRFIRKDPEKSLEYDHAIRCGY